jgi:SAM-dependent methyltransferase
MSSVTNWKRASELFFAERAREIADATTVEGLCYVSGREPRIWAQPEIYADLVESILALCGAGNDARILEVGCASGFLAWGISPRVRAYVGVDVAEPTLRRARQFGLPNAEFRKAEGANLPFTGDSFDAALCYDVFTNFPRFEDGVPIIREMLRVVRPGAKVLIGSIPDEAVKTGYELRVREVGQELEARYGKLPEAPPRPARHLLIDWITRRLLPRRTVQPGILCYYFRRQDFIDLGRTLGTETQIVDIHQKNPYFGYRFNAIYRKRAE